MFLICGNIFSQDLITTAGDEFKNSSIQISFSIGEPVCESFGQTPTFLSQGFQQTGIVVTSIKENKNLNYSIEAYPNPTNSNINLKFSKETPSNVYYLIYNLHGEIIQKQAIKNSETIINFEKLPSSSYIIKVLELNNELKTFNIVKQ